MAGFLAAVLVLATDATAAQSVSKFAVPECETRPNGDRVCRATRGTFNDPAFLFPPLVLVPSDPVGILQLVFPSPMRIDLLDTDPDADGV
ncbi:MAG: hypothetical protein AAF430_23825, partial [Myxococcota bacterium]